MNTIKSFIKMETVLCISVILAGISMFFVHPDSQYVEYIDFRTLAILFCLMAVVSGLRELGVFDWFAAKLLQRVSGIVSIAGVLVLLCFFSSMWITNDVALITFVPFAILLKQKMPEVLTDKWLVRIVVMQTIAANLGSMLTPIGNPQNLYLYGKSGMKIGEFIALQFPYTVTALVILFIWLGVHAGKAQSTGENIIFEEPKETEKNRKKLAVYIVLFVLSLLVVVRVFSYGVLLVLTVCYGLVFDRNVLKKVDYALLVTFVALFIFIGNLGRIPAFYEFLKQMIENREVLTGVVASQVMSNVPAAILLSHFTDDISALIVGVNLGGLGTLIASMASLISFKYIAREYPHLRLPYIALFTVSGIVFLGILSTVYLLV